MTNTYFHVSNATIKSRTRFKFVDSSIEFYNSEFKNIIDDGAENDMLQVRNSLIKFRNIDITGNNGKTDFLNSMSSDITFIDVSFTLNDFSFIIHSINDKKVIMQGCSFVNNSFRSAVSLFGTEKSISLGSTSFYGNKIKGLGNLIQINSLSATTILNANHLHASSTTRLVEKYEDENIVESALFHISKTRTGRYDSKIAWFNRKKKGHSKDRDFTSINNVPIVCPSGKKSTLTVIKKQRNYRAHRSNFKGNV